MSSACFCRRSGERREFLGDGDMYRKVEEYVARNGDHVIAQGGESGVIWILTRQDIERIKKDPSKRVVEMNDHWAIVNTFSAEQLEAYRQSPCYFIRQGRIFSKRRYSRPRPGVPVVGRFYECPACKEYHYTSKG